MDIALIGYGQMGLEIERLAVGRGHRISARFDISSPVIANQLNAGVAIDFSSASVIEYNVETCANSGVNMVIGTTGWSDKIAYIRHVVDAAKIGVVYGSNFSVGMQMFMRIVQQAAQHVNQAVDYDVMLHELHHKRKADSPSGTALSLADMLLRNIDRKKTIQTETLHTRIDASELHLTSTRGGEIAGTHSVYLDSDADTIELTHRAKNRRGFALGAVLAAEWIVDKQGFFEFSEVFDSVMELHRTKP